MAKKKLSNKNIVGTCCPSPCADSPPRLYLDLQDQDVKQLKGLSVGDKVQIMLEGTVKGLSQRERSDYDDPKKTVKTGSIDLENYSLEVVEDEVNEFTKLANDEGDE